MNRMDTREPAVEASFSTSTLTEAMGNTSRSVVLDGYRATPIDVRAICSRRTIAIADDDLLAVGVEQ